MSPYTAVDEITSGPFVAVEVAGRAGRGCIDNNVSNGH
jgi:hypothetical protein